MALQESTHFPETLLSAYLTTISESIVPLTTEAVKKGSKVFGAAILRKSDLSLVIAQTNDESGCPLWHGEVNTIRHFYALPRDKRPLAKECLFLTTHEPCSLCLSAIVWGGFDNFTYLFSYADTRDAFAIPHDLAILHEVFRVPCAASPGSRETKEAFEARPEYNRTNAFFAATSLQDLVSKVTDEQKRAEFQRKVVELKQTYGALSEGYQASKSGAGAAEIPLA